MPIRFAYHPGNVAHSSAPEVDETMRAACRSLDIELIDMPGATSCGAGILGQANRRLQITLNARTMSIAEDLGMDIITPCATTAERSKTSLNLIHPSYHTDQAGYLYPKALLLEPLEQICSCLLHYG